MSEELISTTEDPAFPTTWESFADGAESAGRYYPAAPSTTTSVYDSVVEAVVNASRVHGCSTEVRVWDWDLTSVAFVGDRAPSHISQLPARHLVKIAVFAAASVFAVLGNVSVVGLVLKNRSLRNPLNYYLVNLALADVVIATFCAWTFLVEHVTNSPWVLGPVVCKLSGFVQMTALTGSTLTLMAISADRLMAVKYPLRQLHKHCGKIVLIIWTLAGSASTPFLIYRRLATFKWKDYDENVCTDAWPLVVRYRSDGSCYMDKFWIRTYYTGITVAMFFVPLVVMIATYGLIAWHLFKSQVPGRSELTSTSIIATSADVHRRTTRRKVIRMVFVVMSVFCVCWFPLQFINLYAMWSADRMTTDGHFEWWYEVALFSAYCLAYSNSVINPILYGGLNPSFKRAFINTLLAALRTGAAGQDRDLLARFAVVSNTARRNNASSTPAERARSATTPACTLTPKLSREKPDVKFWPSVPVPSAAKDLNHFPTLLATRPLESIPVFRSQGNLARTTLLSGTTAELTSYLRAARVTFGASDEVIRGRDIVNTSIVYDAKNTKTRSCLIRSFSV